MKIKKTIEVEGNTVKEAVQNALAILKLPRSRVKIELISEEKKGLFGEESAEKAKVRVTVIPQKRKGGSGE